MKKMWLSSFLCFVVVMIAGCGGSSSSSSGTNDVVGNADDDVSSFIQSTEGEKRGGWISETVRNDGSVVRSKGVPVSVVPPEPTAKPYRSKSNPMTRSGEATTSADLSMYLPPIGNQGKSNSCVGWAVGYYYKSAQENIENNRTDLTERSKAGNICSPSFVYNLIAMTDDKGSMPVDSFRVLNDFGCADINTMPFDENDYRSWPSEEAFQSGIKRRTTYANGEFYELSTTNSDSIDQIKQLLLNKKMMLIGIDIFDDVQNIDDYNNIYAVNNVNYRGQGKGGHAQIIVGFDDTIQTPDGTGAFRVVNSWGESWGDDGFYWISYQAMNSKLLIEKKVMWVDDKDKYSSDKVAVFEASGKLNSNSSFTLATGNTSKKFMDFESGGVTVRQENLPDSKIVVDVAEWGTKLTDGAELTLSASSGSYQSNISINSLLYRHGDVEDSAGSTGGSSATITVGDTSNDNSQDDGSNSDDGNDNGDSNNSGNDDTTDPGFIDDQMSVPCENCCSSGISNMASSMGFNMFQMFSWMPFFGDMMNSAAGMFFDKVLDSPQMTLDMIICAKGNSALVDTMITVVDGNPYLLKKMEAIIRVSPLFTAHFTDLAIQNEKLGRFFFAKIDSGLYEAITIPMIYSDTVVRNIGSLMEAHGEGVMQPGTSFANVFFNIGDADNSCDGNELTNERFFYAMFGNLDGAESFLNTLDDLDSDMQGMLMNFVFQGTVQDRYGNTENHTRQGYYNSYAVIKALAEGLAPQMADNGEAVMGIFNRFMPVLLTFDESGNPTGATANGMAFFKALIAAAQLQQDPSAAAIMTMMLGDMQTGTPGMLPSEFVQQMMQMFTEEAVMGIAMEAPAIRNFKGLTCGDSDIDMNAPSCDGDNLGQCGDTTSCEDAGGYWYDNACNAEPSEEPVDVCDTDHLNLCTETNACESAGGYWVDGSCQTEPAPVDGCDSSHLYLCSDESSCLVVGGYWYEDSCNAEVLEQCDAQHLTLCEDLTACSSAGGYWYDNDCNTDPEPVDENYALDARITASSYYSYNHRPSNMADENDNTVWGSRYVGSPYQEEWLQFDLGQSRSMTNVTINWDGNYYPKNYSYWIWDGYRWVIIKDVLKYSAGTSSDQIGNVQSRYLMIRMKNGYRYMGVSEISIQ